MRQVRARVKQYMYSWTSMLEKYADGITMSFCRACRSADFVLMHMRMELSVRTACRGGQAVPSFPWVGFLLLQIVDDRRRETHKPPTWQRNVARIY